MHKSKTFVFADYPKNADELKKMPELDFSSPLSTAAFAMLVLLEYDESPENTIEMLNVLKGPQPMNGMDVQFCVTESRAGDIFLAHILRVHP